MSRNSLTLLIGNYLGTVVISVLTCYSWIHLCVSVSVSVYVCVRLLRLQTQLT